MWKEKNSTYLHIDVRKSLIICTVPTGTTAISLESSGFGLLILKIKALYRKNTRGSYSLMSQSLLCTSPPCSNPSVTSLKGFHKAVVQDVSCYNSALLLFWNVGVPSHCFTVRMQAVHVSRVIFTLKRRSRTVTPNIYVVTETICFLR